jgi:hypothetical protein
MFSRGGEKSFDGSQLVLLETDSGETMRGNCRRSQDLCVFFARTKHVRQDVLSPKSGTMKHGPGGTGIV